MSPEREPTVRRLLQLLFASCLVLSGGCGRERPGEWNDGAASGGDGGRPVVGATPTHRAAIVRQVAGDRVAVDCLMGPGVDPHAYRATPRDADRLARADLIVANGLHLEGKLADLLSRLGDSKRVVMVGEAIPPERLLEDAGVPDPHVWFDAELWSITVETLVAPLSAIDPAGGEGYRLRAAETARRLRSLHERLRETFAAIPERRRVLVTAHDAFGYLGRGYGIDVVGLQGVSTESEAGLADVNRIVDLVVERDVPAVFVETSVPDRSVEAMCEGVRARGRQIRIGGRLYSDALGPSGSGADTLEGMLVANAETILRELSGPGASPVEATDGVSPESLR